MFSEDVINNNSDRPTFGYALTIIAVHMRLTTPRNF